MYCGPKSRGPGKPRDHVLYYKNSVGKCYDTQLEKLDSECMCFY